MSDIKTEYTCPLCSTPSQIIASGGAIRCSTNGGHVWNDTQSFLDLKPKMGFKVQQQQFAPQQNHTEIKLKIPVGTKTALESKFGDKLDATVAGILGMLSEGEVLMVPESDLDRMKKLLNKRPESSGELFGMIYAMQMESTESKQAAETAQREVQAYENSSPGRVVVDLSSVMQQAQEKARDANMPVKMWIQQAITNGIENGWY